MQKLAEVIGLVLMYIVLTIGIVLFKTVISYYLYQWLVYPYTHYEIEFWYMFGIVVFIGTLTYHYQSKD